MTQNVQMWLMAQMKAYDTAMKEFELFCGAFHLSQTIFNNFDVTEILNTIKQAEGVLVLFGSFLYHSPTFYCFARQGKD